MSTENVIIITTSNLLLVHRLNTDSVLEDLQQIVDGWIEVVHPRHLKQNLCMICNEEGAIRGLPINHVASALYGYQDHGNPIFGTVVLLRSGYRNGEPDLVGLTENESLQLANALYSTFPFLN